MVDFNNENTITTAPHDIVKIMILERRKYVIDAIEHYYKQSADGVQPYISHVKSRTIALFYEIHAALARDFDTDKYQKIKNGIFKMKTIEECNEVMQNINQWFDEKRLTKIDTIKKYDTSNVETENLQKGM